MVPKEILYLFHEAQLEYMLRSVIIKSAVDLMVVLIKLGFDTVCMLIDFRKYNADIKRNPYAIHLMQDIIFSHSKSDISSDDFLLAMCLHLQNFLFQFA